MIAVGKMLLKVRVTSGAVTEDNLVVAEPQVSPNDATTGSIGAYEVLHEVMSPDVSAGSPRLGCFRWCI
jgi:hypothetical protein